MEEVRKPSRRVTGCYEGHGLGQMVGLAAQKRSFCLHGLSTWDSIIVKQTRERHGYEGTSE